MSTEKKVKKFVAPEIDVQLAPLRRLCENNPSHMGTYEGAVKIKNNMRNGKFDVRDFQEISKLQWLLGMGHGAPRSHDRGANRAYAGLLALKDSYHKRDVTVGGSFK